MPVFGEDLVNTLNAHLHERLEQLRHSISNDQYPVSTFREGCEIVHIKERWKIERLGHAWRNDTQNCGSWWLPT